MVKTYFKYQLDRTVGNIASSQCNFAYHPQSRRLFSGTCQYVAVINARTGEVTDYLSREGRNRQVRYVAVFGHRLFAGYLITNAGSKTERSPAGIATPSSS